MSTPINLNKVRKARARAEKSARGDANAAAFGVSKAQRDHAKRLTARGTRLLDGTALDASEGSGEPGNEKT